MTLCRTVTFHVSSILAKLHASNRTQAGVVALAGSGVAVVSVDPGDLRTRMQQAAHPGEDISDRPLAEVTMPFWVWLLGQERAAVNGNRYQAQAPNAA